MGAEIEGKLILSFAQLVWVILHPWSLLGVSLSMELRLGKLNVHLHQSSTGDI